MTTEALDESGIAGGHRIEDITHMHSGNGSRRAAQLSTLGRRKGHHRTTGAFLDATGHQPHHTLVPAGIEETQSGMTPPYPARYPGPSHRCLRLRLHAGFDPAALTVQRIQFFSKRAGCHRIARQQATMPMLMSSSRPAAFRTGPTA